MSPRTRNRPTKSELRTSEALERLRLYSFECALTMLDVDLIHVTAYLEDKLNHWPGENSDLQYAERYAMYDGYMAALRKRGLLSD